MAKRRSRRVGQEISGVWLDEAASVPDVARSYPWGSFPDNPTIWGELAEITRRAVVPHAFVQIYTTSPLMAGLFNAAKRKDAADG